MMGGGFGGRDGGTIGLWILRSEEVGTGCRGTTILLSDVQDCEVTGGQEDG